MRRGSIIGPIILIALGVLFLVHNLRPDLPVLSLVGDWWPLALIAWGAIRLAEITIWKMSGRPLPLNGVSGGEWVFIVFLCLVGSSLFFANRYRDRWPQARINMHGLEILGESYDYAHGDQKLAAVGKTPRVLVENLRGNARIVGAAGEEVTATGRLNVRSFQQTDAENVSKQCKLEIVRQGDLIVVRTNHDRATSSSAKVSSDLEITVPRGATLEARGRYGDFEIVDIDGAVTVDSDNAGVRISNAGGAVKVATRASDIIRVVNAKSTVEISGRGQDIELDTVEGQVTINGSYHGEQTLRKLAKPLRIDDPRIELRCERVPGSVSISRGEFSANDVAGPVLVKATSKDVQLSNFTQSLEMSVERGDIEIRPGRTPLGKMDVKTRAGNVHFSLPPGARFDLEATTDHGEVDNEYGEPLQKDDSGKGGSIRGKSAGGGGPEIRIQTRRGEVVVTKGGAADAPATPSAPKAPQPPRVETL